MYMSVCEKIQRTLMSSCAFARASSLRTEVMTASLRALRSFITMESILCYSSLRAGKRKRGQTFVWSRIGRR